MKGARTAVLDACVLIPMPLADTLLRLAAGPHLYSPKWSDRIMEEVIGLSMRTSVFRPKRRCIAKAKSGGTSRRLGSKATSV